MRPVTRTFCISQLALLMIIAATALPLCGQMFRCGCTLSTAATHCNIHRPAEPPCPWCAHDSRAFILSFAIILPITAAVLYSAARWRKSIPLATLLGAIVYLLLGMIAGWITAKSMGYPTWFGLPV